MRGAGVLAAYMSVGEHMRVWTVTVVAAYLFLWSIMDAHERSPPVKLYFVPLFYISVDCSLFDLIVCLLFL